MKEANGVTTNGAADKKRQEDGVIKEGWNPMFETTQFPDRTRGSMPDSDDDDSQAELKAKKPATSRYVSEFHPLSYLYTVVRGNLDDDCDKDGNPRLPTAIPGVLNRRLGREFNAKIGKLNREIDDIQKRIDGMHEMVNSLNKERCNADAQTNGMRNFGNEIYLLVRNVGMWMRRMETKAQLIERIEWSIYILEALQEIDEICNATMFWSYAAWRKIQHKIGPNGCNEDWDNDLGNNEPKYDKYQCDSPDIIRIFKGYEAAYRRNIEISKLIKDDLIRSGSDEKLSRFLDDNYTRCKGCKALFCRRYDDLFGTRIHCPSRIKARENLLAKGTTGEEDGSNLIVCFFCTDCFDIFNPSIIKKIKRDKELKREKDLEVLIEEHQQEQDDIKNAPGTINTNSNGTKSSKKRKKKKRKKAKKNNASGSSSSTLTNGAHNKISHEEQPSDTEQDAADRVSMTYSGSYDDNEKSANGLDEKENRDSKDAPLGLETDAYDGDAKSDEIDMNGDSSMNDVWVDFLLKTGSIIELNAFMDKTIGIEKV